MVHTNFGGNSYGPIIGPSLFLGKFVWTNGPESSSKVSPTLVLVHGWPFLDFNMYQALPRRRLVRSRLVRRRLVSGDGAHVSAAFSRPERGRTVKSLTEIHLVFVFPMFLKRRLVAAPLPLTQGALKQPNGGKDLVLTGGLAIPECQCILCSRREVWLKTPTVWCTKTIAIT